METRQDVNLQGFEDKVQSPKEKTDEKGNILRLKQGYNPNSSSVGSVIFVLPGKKSTGTGVTLGKTDS
jgi:hypothetical protein